jgi:hypothetical protein
MNVGRIVVPFDAGIYCESGVLTWVGHCSIGKIQCRIYAPSPYPTRISFEPGGLNVLDPPNQDEYYTLPMHHRELGWPLKDWGYINSQGTVTIKAVGIDLLGAPPASDEELLQFDKAIVEWRRVFHDWLSVMAKGATDFESCESGVKWISEELNRRLVHASYQAGEIYKPQPVTRWEWNHAFKQVAKNEEAPLARKLLSLAIRDAARADNRSAVIHAATAAECALTDGLTLYLSNTLASEEIKSELNKNKMLGKRLELAQSYGLSVPCNARKFLLEPRNAVIHAGSHVTQSVAWEAVNIASEIVNGFVPFPERCEEPTVWYCEEDYEDMT